ncbi:MAG: DUF3307 domain-containing protein [Lacrimispora sp.]
MVFKLLVIGHLLGTFYFQTGKPAKGSLRHCFIYFMALLAVTAGFVPVNKWAWLLGALLLAAGLHKIIDFVKLKLKTKGYIIFLLDQLLHIGVLYAIMKVFYLNVSDDCLIYRIFDQTAVEKNITPLLAGLICWRPASVFVSTVFQSIPDTIKNADIDCPFKPDHGEEVKIGAWIGILEREIILILGLLNQFGAIGFALTAKSLARYKQLENKAFAEKYLVGTLLSALTAIFSILLCRQ